MHIPVLDLHLQGFHYAIFIPPRVEYSLTDKGRALFPIFYDLYKWLSEYPPQ
ncbi:MAG: winged helix-turn-helix transcriptional regulator [Candidatus Methanomethylophilaceae archaeon]|nr:winged helix-turn-helix transcriptional regulator [Candidatus Methanomethylophilaceae archaeon]